MSIHGIGDDQGGFGQGVTATNRTQQENRGMDRQTFGAAVVNETLDLMNTNASGKLDSSYDFQKQVLGAFAGVDAANNNIGPVDKETFGASVVTSTLDNMNRSPSGDMDASYDFQNKVLGAYAGAGTILDTKG